MATPQTLIRKEIDIAKRYGFATGGREPGAAREPRPSDFKKARNAWRKRDGAQSLKQFLRGFGIRKVDGQWFSV
jgi:hypothetical protein